MKPPAARALPLLGGVLLLLLAVWTGAIAQNSAALRDQANAHVRWLRQLQDAVFVLQTNHPEEPVVAAALDRIDRVADEIDRDTDLDDLSQQLRASTAALRQGLVDGERRTELRQGVFTAQERMGAAIWQEVGRLRSGWERHSQEVLVLAILAVLLAAAGLGLAAVAWHRQQQATALGRQLEAALTEARAAQRDAEAASRAKTDFLATMSHEIRTPLTAILGTVELLGHSALKPRQQEQLDTIDQAGEALLALIDDALDLSRIEAGRLELTERPFDLEALLDGIVLLFGGRAHAAGLQLHVVVGADVPGKTHGDPDRLRQVLFNLVGNALKFTDEGHVRIDVRRAGGDRVTIEVADTGPGVPASFVPEAFHAFTQADPSSTRRHGGAGLGLAIAARIVEAAGGTIDVVPGVERGSVFRVALPLRPLEPRPLPALPACAVLGTDATADALVDQLRAWGGDVTREAEEGRHLIATGPMEVEGAVQVRPFGRDARVTWPVRPGLIRRLFEPDPSTEELEPTTIAPEVDGLRVLLVDDNEINRIVLGGMLERLGCSVETANNGAEALVQCTARAFDLVFMDCDMPEIDGVAATQALRASDARSADSPVVGISGHAGGRVRAQALAAGMDGYLSKPLRLDDLRGAIAEFAPQERRITPG